MYSRTRQVEQQLIVRPLMSYVCRWGIAPRAKFIHTYIPIAISSVYIGYKSHTHPDCVISHYDHLNLTEALAIALLFELYLSSLYKIRLSSLRRLSSTMLPRNPRVNTLVSIVFGLLLTIVHASPISNDTSAPKPGEGSDFNWNSITPTPNLVYHRCYNTFECARLEVPLDYLSSKPYSENASIAIIKLASDPTRFPEYGKKWGGPVLLNPGGPGGSGVGMVLESWRNIQKIIGKQFSIIGFDPRGVNNTRPLVSCFDSAVDRILWDVKGRGRILGSSEEGLGEAFVRGKVMGRVCTSGKRAEEGKFLGTASVARDMLAINDATWDLAKSGIRKGLQYWGFSYGSVLGITFATLFPDKVERMVIDGVVDVFDFFASGGMKNLQDTEDVMDSFYIFCSQAGPQKCAFHTGTTPNDIRDRHYAVLASLRTQPLAYNVAALGELGESEGQPDIFTYDDLRWLTFRALYSPLTLFQNLTNVLVEVEKRLPEGFLPVDISGRKLPLTCSAGSNDIANEILRSAEALPAIMCSDASPSGNMTIPIFSERLRILKSQSPTAGDIWPTYALACLGWNAQAKWKPVFSMTNNNSKKRKGGVPILLIGNTADPVTPLANAYSMAKLFPTGGAVVAIQEGEGHCSPSVPTKCMSSIVQTYFGTGKVPEGDQLHCARESAPFLGDVSTGNMTRRDAGRIEAREAMMDIGRAVNRQLAYSGSLGNSRFAHLLGGE